MTKIADVKEIDKIMRTELIAQTNVNPKCILNARSIYGASLEKSVDSSNTIIHSINEHEVCLVFALDSDETSDNMIEDIDNELIAYDSYIFSVVVYGDKCNEYAKAISSRFQTEEVLLKLHQQGIHIQNVEDSKDMSEFVNNVYIKRRDIIIHISCQLKITKITKLDEYEQINTLEVMN